MQVECTPIIQCSFWNSFLFLDHRQKGLKKWRIESHCEGVWVPEVATLPAGLTASGWQAGEAIFQHGAISQGGRLLQSFLLRRVEFFPVHLPALPGADRYLLPVFS